VVKNKPEKNSSTLQEGILKKNYRGKKKHSYNAGESPFTLKVLTLLN
jgi:hypothetical protein